MVKHMTFETQNKMHIYWILRQDCAAWS